MAAKPRLKGIFCPHMVPLDAWGRINEPELRRLVEWLIARGVHGLYPNGSCGEFTLFTVEERRRIVEIVVDQAAGRAVVMAGGTEATVDLTLAACEHYAAVGADCVALVPPYYFKMSQPNVREHFTLLAKHSPIDLVLYNIPQFANEIAVDTVRELAELPRIIGIKDSSRDFPRYLNPIAAVRPQRPDFSFMIGCEEILVPSLLMGGDGGTLATSGVVPEIIVGMYQAVVDGRLAEAVRLQYSVLDLIRTSVFGAMFPEGMRAAIGCRGFDMGASRTPLAPESRVDVAQVRSIMERHLADLGCPLNDGYCAGPAVDRTPPTPLTRTEGSQLDTIVSRVVAQMLQNGRS